MSNDEPQSISVICDDLDAALRHYTEELGFEVDEVFPADSPRLVVVSQGNQRVRLEKGDADKPQTAEPISAGLVVTPATAGAWHAGRAGMAYRDLLPGRSQGRVIASHIRIPDGGPVPDYVHYHQVVFQIIFCVRGWVRVVYEDQGPPFVMEPGDCVLQPPQIRHRVLECSDGLEVVEISAPAEHRTIADRSRALPAAGLDPHHVYGGQRFVFHEASRAEWVSGPAAGWETTNTGIDEATGGLGSVTALRTALSDRPLRLTAGDGLSFQFVLRGAGHLEAGGDRDWALGPCDGFAVPQEEDVRLTAGSAGMELLRVTLSGAGQGARADGVAMLHE